MHLFFRQENVNPIKITYIPLITNTVLDFIHYKFRDLENRVLIDTFHINRLKLAVILTSASTVTNQ